MAKKKQKTNTPQNQENVSADDIYSGVEKNEIENKGIPPETISDMNEISGDSPENMQETLSESAVPLKKFKVIKGKISAFFKRTGIPDMAMLRFIAVFFFASAINIDVLKDKEIWAVSKWQDFIGEVHYMPSVIIMICGFILLSAIHYFMPERYRITDQSFSIAAVLYFDVVLLWKANDFNLSLGVMIISLIFIYYSWGKLKSKKLYNRIPWWVCGLFILVSATAVAVFIGITTVCKHRNFGTACHDFGLFVQMYHSLADNGTAVTTCERDTFMSHFKIHASYIFYLLVPVFKLFPDGETLLIAQGVLAMGGAVPMFLIAKRHNIRGLSLIFICFAYIFCNGLIGPCYYEFHENAFLPTLLMWLLWAVDGRKYIMLYIMSALVCIVKEDAPLYVACVAMFMFFENKGDKKRFNCLIITVVSMIYMFVITSWLTKNGDGQMMMSTRFNNLMIDKEAGLKEVIKNVIIDPSYFFSLFFHDDTRIFFFQVMTPLLFIPFFTKKIRRFLLMIPFVIMNLVIGAGYGYAANIGFQYIFGPVTLLLYMCIINIEDMGQRGKQDIPIALGSAAMILSIGTYSHYWGYYTSYKDGEDYLVALDTALDEIPKDAAVGADVFSIPHLADHKELYIFDNNDFTEEGIITTPEKFDFIVIPILSEFYDVHSADIENGGYTLYNQVDGRYAIYVSPDYNISE
ncbi:MAG: DUF2079 domain-containing protein [Ruminococcus sp.]|nr:DUF2079 domain-containing protein [Ruminococcus sp.]